MNRVPTQVRRMVPDFILSTVNLCEVVGKYAQKTGASVESIRSLISVMTSEITPFDEHQAFLAASWHKTLQPFGLSLGDRACLALARVRSLPVLTADRIWQTLDIGVQVVLIR